LKFKENDMSVYKKLNNARLELQGTKLNKSGHNKFAGYKYFELGDFLPTINNIFSNAGLCGVVSFTADLATLTITDVDDNSQIVITSPMGSAALKGCHEVQNVGAVETYQRRYLWVVAMEIVEHDVLDAVTGSDNTAQKPVIPELKSPEYSKEEMDILHSLAEGFTAFVADGNFDEAKVTWDALDNEQKSVMWGLLPSNIRSAYKKYSSATK
jgi:hypothetical protein